ncbi:hypothetical protein BB558_002188 [Smittium angustum]|uniref:Intimal thickness related receptor IRP domain-containing protein n=1 Tax=Smittium angustum TaxID=133377 RepID=A0A2U1J9G4_SMIAN|nr:hypothetical protein BB558_002188 [Smittium angustum]
MKKPLNFLFSTTFLAFTLLSCCLAEYGKLSSRSQGNLKCAGIYKGNDKKSSEIALSFDPISNSNITILIFNWKDSSQIGITKNGDNNQTAGDTKLTICDESSVSSNLCSADDIGRVLINNKDKGGKQYKFTSIIYNDLISMKNSVGGYTLLEHKDWLKKNPNGTVSQWIYYSNTARKTILPITDGSGSDQEASISLEWTQPGMVYINYNVNTTGYYCVDSVSLSDFSGKAFWKNWYGYLPASEYIKLSFYRTLTLFYAICWIIWAYMSYRVWSDVLPLQHHIWFLIGIMIVNMGLSYTYWENYNFSGTTNTFLAIAMVFFGAARNSLSFFLFLVVSLGWGIVRPTLGSTMKKCVALLVLHFISGCIYGTSVAFRDQNELNDMSLFVVLPISIFTTIYYVWTMKAVLATTHILETRRQSYKLDMFNKMWKLLMFNIVAFTMFIVLNIIQVSLFSNGDYIVSTWKWRWLMIDGWLNFQFFITFVVVLWWWRPTSNNHRYGLEQLAHDEGDAWERGPSHDGHAMMLADERDFQLALEEADQVADSFVLTETPAKKTPEPNQVRSSEESGNRDIFNEQNLGNNNESATVENDNYEIKHVSRK